MNLKEELKECFLQCVDDCEVIISKELRTEVITNIYHLFQNTCSDPDVDIKQELIDLFDELMVENKMDVMEFKDFIETIISEYMCIFEEYCNEDVEEIED